MESRFLQNDEAKLVKSMLAFVQGSERLIAQLLSCKVYGMNDGAMGSLKFSSCETTEFQRRFSRCICEAEFLDADGMQVSAALNLDQNGDLFDLDVWKKDFSSLIRYPTSSEIRLLPRE